MLISVSGFFGNRAKIRIMVINEWRQGINYDVFFLKQQAVERKKESANKEIRNGS